MKRIFALVLISCMLGCSTNSLQRRDYYFGSVEEVLEYKNENYVKIKYNIKLLSTGNIIEHTVYFNDPDSVHILFNKNEIISIRVDSLDNGVKYFYEGILLK